MDERIGRGQEDDPVCEYEDGEDQREQEGCFSVATIIPSVQVREMRGVFTPGRSRVCPERQRRHSRGRLAVDRDCTECQRTFVLPPLIRQPSRILLQAFLEREEIPEGLARVGERVRRRDGLAWMEGLLEGRVVVLLVDVSVSTG